MKLLKILSVIAFLAMITCIFYSGPNELKAVKKTKKQEKIIIKKDSLDLILMEMIKTSAGIQVTKGEITDEYVEKALNILETTRNQISEKKMDRRQDLEEEGLLPSNPNMFWIKVIFSFIVSLSALWIILAGKYSEGKEKWAFSILSLIAGIWIGPML